MNAPPEPKLTKRQGVASLVERLDGIERRLALLEANMDLCLNYVRELALERLGAARLAEIEERIFPAAMAKATGEPAREFVSERAASPKAGGEP